jgi:hypothetical protein
MYHRRDTQRCSQYLPTPMDILQDNLSQEPQCQWDTQMHHMHPAQLPEVILVKDILELSILPILL